MEFSAELVQVVRLIGSAIGLAMTILILLVALSRIAASFIDLRL